MRNVPTGSVILILGMIASIILSTIFAPAAVTAVVAVVTTVVGWVLRSPVEEPPKGGSGGAQGESSGAPTDLGGVARVLVWVLGRVAATATLVGVLVLGAACGAISAEPAKYGAKLEACLQTSQTCEQYIDCRDRVQLAEGRGHYRATCADAGLDAADGGAK
jgi:hypothetical protein